MSFILNTNAVDERDRAEFVHEALAATMVPIELQWLTQPQGVAAHGVITELGDLTVCSGRTSAFRVKRTPALARDTLEPSIFVNVQLSGSSVVVQDDREAVLQPGGPAAEGEASEAYLACHPNFLAIRRYNPSDFYCISVGLIGDRVTG